MNSITKINIGDIEKANKKYSGEIIEEKKPDWGMIFLFLIAAILFIVAIYFIIKESKNKKQEGIIGETDDGEIVKINADVSMTEIQKASEKLILETSGKY